MFNRSCLNLFVFVLASCLVFTLDTFGQAQTKRIRIIKDQTELRLKPDPESLVIGKLPIGSEFEAEDVAAEWFKIALPPDQAGIVVTGYVHSTFAEIVGIKPSLAPKLELNPSMAIPAGQDYLDWQKRLDRARSGKTTWDVVGIVGAVTLVSCAIGTIIELAGNETEPDEDAILTITTSRKLPTGWIIGDIGGFVVMMAGIAGQSGASKKIKLLEEEGKQKGYLQVGLVMNKGHLGIGFRYSF